MEKPSTTSWIIGGAAVMGGFAAGYLARARDIFRPGPGHVYRIGLMFFGDDALVRRLRYQFPGAVQSRGASGALLMMPPGCYALVFTPWDAPSRLPQQVGRIYRLVELREGSIRDLIEDWDRAGIVQFVGAWSSWPDNPEVAPDEWAPPGSST